MIRIWTMILGAWLSIGAIGHEIENDLAVAYVERYSAIAISEMQDHGIPASIKLGQALLESNYGTSVLAQRSQNHFGLKCKDYWEGKKYYHEDDDFDTNGKLIKSCFRSYDQVEDSYRDHSDFLLHSPTYKTLFEIDKTDYRAWAKGLKACGYATDPTYPEKLIRIIERYGLTRYDRYTQSHDAQVVLQTKWKTNHKPPEPFLIPDGYIMGTFKKH